MYFIPDIIFFIFIVVQDICFDRNVLFIAMFLPFEPNNNTSEAAELTGQGLGELSWRCWKTKQKHMELISLSSCNEAKVLPEVLMDQDLMIGIL